MTNRSFVFPSFDSLVNESFFAVFVSGQGQA